MDTEKAHGKTRLYGYKQHGLDELESMATTKVLSNSDSPYWE